MAATTPSRGPIDVVLDVGPDLDVIVRQVVEGRSKRGKASPSRQDIATGITDVKITDTMQGSSTLTITFSDEQFVLMDQGFFDIDEDGKVDKLDLNYPDRSRLWWRLTQVTPNGRGMFDLVFMERPAAYLQAHHGPVKASRAKMTRAQFLKSLADKVNAGGGIRFISTDLTVKQTVEGSKADTSAKDKAKAEDDATKPKSDKARKVTKSGGINRDEDVKIKGAKASEDQIANVETVLDVAAGLDAPALAILAMVCAGIGESGFKAIMNQSGSPYGGVLQGNVGGGVFDINDTAGMAKCFLKGGKGFQGGGAIAIANAHPDMGPGLIALTVEGSRSNFGSDAAAEHFYGQYKEEARALIAAYGGVSGRGTTYNKQYNFEVGSPESPHEDYWAAMTRLADEVKWPLFLDGNYLYFDPEPTLIRQKPAAVIRREDPAVVDWSGTWDNRQIATEMELTLICGPFEFRAGEVFKLEGFGPLSSGSTVGKKGDTKNPPLPGRWLIAEIERSRYELASTFKLKQPEDPNPEPSAGTAERDDADAALGGGDLFEVCKRISDEGHTYPHPDTHHGAFSSFTKDTPLDCSESSYYALHLAGYYDGSQAQVSGTAASSYGEPGHGREWTVYANGGHMFIQSEGSGRKWRFDTGGHPGVSGPRVVFAHRPTGGFVARRHPSQAPDGDADTEKATK